MKKELLVNITEDLRAYFNEQAYALLSEADNPEAELTFMVEEEIEYVIDFIEKHNIDYADYTIESIEMWMNREMDGEEFKPVEPVIFYGEEHKEENKENTITPEEFEAYDYYVMEQEWLSDLEEIDDGYWYFCRFVDVDSTPDYFYEEDEPDYDPDNVSDITRIRQIIDKCKNYAEVTKYCYIDWDSYYNIEVKRDEDWKKYNPYSFYLLYGDLDIEGSVKERIASYIKNIDNDFPDLLYLCRAALVFKPLNSSSEANLITETEIEESVIAESVIEEAEEDFIEEDFIDEDEDEFIEDDFIDEDDEDGFDWSIDDIEQPTESITEAVLPEAAEPTIEEPAAPEADEQPEPADIMPEPENINDNEEPDINIENLFEDNIEEPEACCLPATVTVTDIIESNSELRDKLLFFKTEIDYAKSILYKLGSDKLYKKVKLNKYAQFKTVDTTIQAAGRLIDEHENMMNAVITKSDELLESGNTEQAEELLIMLIHDARLNEFIRGARTTLDKLYRYCEGSIAYLRVKPAEQKKEVTLASVLEGIQ